MVGGVIVLCVLLLAFICVLALVVAAALGKLWKGGCLRRLRTESLGMLSSNNTINMWDEAFSSAPRMKNRMGAAPMALEWHPEWNNSKGQGSNHSGHSMQNSMQNSMQTSMLLSSGMGGVMRDGTRVMAQPRMHSMSMGEMYGASNWDEWEAEKPYNPSQFRGSSGVPQFKPPTPPAPVSPKTKVAVEGEELCKFTASVSLSDAMWGYGVLLERFIHKTPPKNEVPLDYEGLYFLLRGCTAEQILLMVLCLEALVFTEAPKYTNRVWTLVLRYYVENTKWVSDERIPPIPTEQARKHTKEAEKLVLAWHQFERACVQRLSKYWDVKERTKALEQIDMGLPRRPDVMEVEPSFHSKNSMPMQVHKENMPIGNAKAPRGDEDESRPGPKRAKRDLSPLKEAPCTPLRKEAGEKNMRSPSAAIEEPTAKRPMVAVDLVPNEYTYRSIDGELRVFTIQEKSNDTGFKDSKDNGFLFTQMSKSCLLQKSNLWYVGDLGQGYRVRLQPVNSSEGACCVDLQFAPGPRKRWQNLVTATSTKR